MTRPKPRNPADVIGALWLLLAKHPELRVGQAIVNATGGDPFYIEDEDLARRLDAEAASGK